ncbi:class I SAM-dependent methyltransferase, partial [bacterium]|nr:class I SAM-dependent methyltransferase [bacterium]
MLSKLYKRTSTGVWERPDAGSFDYSDGKYFEERLLRQLRSADDLSIASDELQRMMIDWPSEYHLSPLRLNLLSPFNFTNVSTILEVGSGCGAITRQLGETCPDSKILALEGSRRRAEITRTRCRDLENVQVCCDSFADFNSQKSLDLITMIGVLEYSPSFFNSSNPVVEALKHARSMLDTNGAMIIAIENQLGLKYFNGCSEDHNGKIFGGINDQYLPDTVKTFGKNELQSLVEEAGFENVEFIYPFPDYKLPQLMLREEAFKNNTFNAGIMAGQYPSRDYICSGTKLFRETSVWNVLDRNDMLPNFSNSFLLFAFNGKGSIEDLTEPWLAKTYTSRRKKRYHIETTFLESDDKIVV